MEISNLSEVLNKFTDRLEIPEEVEFNYNKGMNWIISKTSYELDIDNDGDFRDYLIVVKMNKTQSAGTVIVGESDGIAFYDYKILGQIVLDNHNWLSV